MCASLSAVSLISGQELAVNLAHTPATDLKKPSERIQELMTLEKSILVPSGCKSLITMAVVFTRDLVCER